LYIFQYSYIAYLSRIISYYFKRIDVSYTYHIRYTYRICACNARIQIYSH